MNIMNYILSNEEIKESIFKKFVNEIENFEKIPCDEPYDLSQITNKKAINVLKDIDENRNHPWIKEIYEVNKKEIDNIAMLYRGEKLSYKDLFVMSYVYACAFKQAGIKKGDEFVCAIENTPEFPFIMGATSIVGAKVNLLSAEMDKEYIADMISRSKFPYVFVSDMSFAKFSNTLKIMDKKVNVVPLPLEYSLKKGNQYRELTEKFYKLDEKEYNDALNSTENVVNVDDFLKKGLNYDGKVLERTGLNDDFTITYTSGSTGWRRPKALIHRVRSYISMGRYHDPKISGIPKMKGAVTLALVKTMSDTDFMSNISDNFMQGGTVALEPINDKEYFLTSLLINKPTLAIASRSYWIYLMKQFHYDESIKNIKLPFLFVPLSAGEPLAANEEKALNKWLRKVNAGIDVTKVPFSVMSVAGGDSEHGGIFLSLFRSLQSKKPSHIGINEPIGMATYDMVRVKALREDGSHCDYMEMGQLVADSPCTMEGYLDNPEENKKFFITDKYGNRWANLNTYGYVDKTNHVYVKGRISKSDSNIPNFMIQDEILRDTKKIMSCEVVNFDYNGENVYVAHIEPQMDVSFNTQKVLEGAKKRCVKKFGEDILKVLYFRVRTNEESFELLHTGKRNNIALVEEGISDKCISASLNDNDNAKVKIFKRK